MAVKNGTKSTKSDDTKKSKKDKEEVIEEEEVEKKPKKGKKIKEEDEVEEKPKKGKKSKDEEEVEEKPKKSKKSKDEDEVEEKPKKGKKSKDEAVEQKKDKKTKKVEAIESASCEMEDDADYVFVARTAQVGAFKQALGNVSHIVSDCNIFFVKPKPKENNPGGMRIFRMTEEKDLIIKLGFDADKFEYFKCEEDKITVGVDMSVFNSYIKNIKDDHLLQLYMRRGNKTTLFIKSINGAADKVSEATDIELNLMEIEEPRMKLLLEKETFDNRFVMASDNFYNICKTFNGSATYIEIINVGNELIFQGKNDSGKIKKTYTDTGNKVAKKKNQKIIQNVYELKNLLYFSKSNKLCENIDIWIKEDFPLLLGIPVADLGKMFIFLMPIINHD